MEPFVINTLSLCLSVDDDGMNRRTRYLSMPAIIWSRANKIFSSFVTKVIVEIVSGNTKKKLVQQYYQVIFFAYKSYNDTINSDLLSDDLFYRQLFFTMFLFFVFSFFFSLSLSLTLLMHNL